MRLPTPPAIPPVRIYGMPGRSMLTSRFWFVDATKFAFQVNPFGPPSTGTMFTELPALVLHAPDVRGDEVRQRRASGGGNAEEQVGGLLVVVIDAAGHPIPLEAIVDAEVRRRRFFPAEIRIRRARADGGDEPVPEIS